MIFHCLLWRNISVTLILLFIISRTSGTKRQFPSATLQTELANMVKGDLGCNNRNNFLLKSSLHEIGGVKNTSDNHLLQVYNCRSCNLAHFWHHTKSSATFQDGFSEELQAVTALLTQNSCTGSWNQHCSYSPSLYEDYQSAIKSKTWKSCEVYSRYSPYWNTTQDWCICYRKQCVTWTPQCAHFIISSWSGKCQLQWPYVSSISPTFYCWLPIFSSHSANTVPQISSKQKRLAALTCH
jgi:hypothetical protein